MLFTISLRQDLFMVSMCSTGMGLVKDVAILRVSLSVLAIMGNIANPRAELLHGYIGFLYDVCNNVTMWACRIEFAGLIENRYPRVFLLKRFYINVTVTH